MNDKIINNHILICPLDWGLGHATRCIPIIKKLANTHNKLIIATSGDALSLLKKEFPYLQFEKLPSYQIKYMYSSMILNMLVQLPKIISVIIKEKKLIKKLIAKHSISLIISDNRFGCYSKKIRSIFITHQINIQCHPFIKPLVDLMNYTILKHYHEIWIPDDNKHSLSGKLSKNVLNLPNCQFIGPLSRFEKENIHVNQSIKWDALIILSGPEPQRSIFEQMIIHQIHHFPEMRFLLIRGISDHLIELKETHNCKIIDIANTQELAKHFKESEIVISRSGYSSIMDYTHLNVKPILVPTPGQTEQEYLAHYLSEKGIKCFAQNEFSLEKIFCSSSIFKPLEIKSESFESFMARI